MDICIEFGDGFCILGFFCLFFIYYYLEVMVNSLIKLKLFKLTMIGVIAGGISAVAVASIVAKEMCKKKKKTSEEK